MVWGGGEDVERRGWGSRFGFMGDIGRLLIWSREKDREEWPF
jgi:hypothetical protein